jgi:hypothetical protein
MAYRTGTYFAFDGLGQTDPTKSDFRYYATVQGWHGSAKHPFNFVNSHDKAGAVRDTSKLETLQASIRQRLASSKNMVVILSKDTRKSGSLLSWEIEKAVDVYKLPLIIAYTGVDSVLEPSAHSARWPNTLRARIDNHTAEAIHIPFKRDAMFDAINQFTVNGTKIGGPLVHYDRNTHVMWNYLP